MNFITCSLQVDDIVQEMVLEEFIENYVIEHEVEEEISEIAKEVLEHYDTKIEKRELREVNDYQNLFNLYDSIWRKGLCIFWSVGMLVSKQCVVQLITTEPFSW